MADPGVETIPGMDVTAHIRAAILEGEFAPHQRLIEADLTEQFGASRAAVRTALLTLAGEGLVERLPNRGARVRAISVREAIEIVEVRVRLESLVARKAAEAVDDEGVAELTRLRERIQAAVAGGDLVTYTATHQELDRTVRRISAHTTATQLLERLQAQSARHQFRLGFLPGRAATSAPEHIAIIDAIIAGDPDRADAATRAHLEGIVGLLRAMD